MQKQCRDCAQVCKKLSELDEPIHYRYNEIDAEQVVQISREAVLAFPLNYLRLRQLSLSHGNQLAVMLERSSGSSAANSYEDCIVFVIQATRNDLSSTDVWIRYGTPDSCCRDTLSAGELTILIGQILKALRLADMKLEVQLRS
jgi:hypothetical protein